MPKDRTKPSILNAEGTGRAKTGPKASGRPAPAGQTAGRSRNSPAAPGKAPATASAPGRIRIVGGLWKRTPLQVIDAPGLRPTPDRVRENLFNWLGPAVQGARVLDLFAGSGALGLEALSRGAARAHFNEPRREAAEAIEQLLQRLQRPAGATWTVSRLDALLCLSRQPPASLDLVFLDPPFHQGWLDRVLPALMPALARGARVYIEAEQDMTPPGLVGLKRGRAGQVHYHLFQCPALPVSHPATGSSPQPE